MLGGGIPGAGKTAFGARTVCPADAIVLDFADVRRSLGRRLGHRVPYGV